MTAARLNIEFVSAYPTHPLSGEDAYAAITGDVLARLYAHLGWSVTREYLVNDNGPQIDALARSVFASLSSDSPPEDAGLAALMAQLPNRYREAARSGQEEPRWLPDLSAAMLALMMRKIRGELNALGVRFDAFTSEAALHLETSLPAELAALRSRGLLTKDGKLDTKRAGDTHARALAAPDGSATYFAADLVYHADKLARGYDRLVTVLRHDHAAYASGIRAATSLLSAGAVELHTHVLAPVRPAAPDSPPPALSELLALMPPAHLRHLALSGLERLELPPAPLEIKALQEAEQAQRSALCLPVTGTAASDLTETLQGAAEAADPRPLYAAAQRITSEALGEGRISPDQRSALFTLRQIMGLPEEESPHA